MPSSVLMSSNEQKMYEYTINTKIKNYEKLVLTIFANSIHSQIQRNKNTLDTDPHFLNFEKFLRTYDGIPKINNLQRKGENSQ